MSPERVIHQTDSASSICKMGVLRLFVVHSSRADSEAIAQYLVHTKDLAEVVLQQAKQLFLCPPLQKKYSEFAVHFTTAEGECATFCVHQLNHFSATNRIEYKQNQDGIDLQREYSCHADYHSFFFKKSTVPEWR